MTNAIPINNQATPYFAGAQPVTQTFRDELLAEGHTLEDYVLAQKNIACLMINYGADIAYRTTMAAFEKLSCFRQYYKARGYKCEVNRMRDYARSWHNDVELMVGAQNVGISRAMNQVLWEDLEPTINRMRFTFCHLYQNQYHPQSMLMAFLVNAHAMCEYAIGMIHKREEEVRKYSPSWAVKQTLFPVQLARTIERVIDRLTWLTATEDIRPQMDRPEVEEALLEIDAQITDVNCLELYYAYGIEQSEGSDALKAKSMDSYYLLHPMEDPEWLKKKALEEVPFSNEIR